MAIERDDLKAKVMAEVDARRQELIDLSLRIHSHPETALQETQASTWLCDYLEEHGLRVERGYCGLETAFRASAGVARPLLAFLAEYDALPGMGHACGHNIIAASAVGAAVAVRTVVEATGGGVAVIGTPAEESRGGKGMLAERGAFADLDAAMLVHPGSRDIVGSKLLACAELTVEYFGREAHAASRPDAGINALDALVIAYNAISALRQHIRNTSRVHGIITDGGMAPNVVPKHSAGSFLVRAEDDAYLEELKEKVMACFEAGARATGCRLEHRWSPVQYSAMRSNGPLAESFRSNMAALGRTLPEEMPSRASGSSDMGNVSALVPAIHPTVAIAPPEVGIHSAEFAACAASEDGHRGLIDAAKALAMTAVDVLVDEDLRARMRDAFLSGPDSP